MTVWIHNVFEMLSEPIRVRKFDVTNVFAVFVSRKESGVTARTDEFQDKRGGLCVSNEALCVVFPARSLPWLCSRRHEWKATRAHMLRFVSTRWRLKGRYERRDEIRIAVVYFLAGKTEQKGLWQKYHIMSSVTVLLWMRPKWDSLLYYILVLRANIIEDKLLLKDVPFIVRRTKPPDLLLCGVIFHSVLLQTQQTFHRRQQAKETWREVQTFHCVTRWCCENCFDLLEWHEGRVQHFGNYCFLRGSISISGCG